MSENIYPGGPVMIKIDGTKIRQLREQKGLTQLYVATAVDVTTDTVSRWENKRYPSIKKENGLKLAHALEVDLEEILESTPDTPGNEAVPPVSKIESAPESEEHEKRTNNNRFLSRKTSLLLTLMFIPLLGVILYLLFFQNGEVQPVMNVTRTVSTHFIPGQPLPVFIHISSSAEEPLSFILRENLPPGTQVLSTYPETSTKHKKNISVQWLGNVSGSTLFTYTLSTAESFTGSLLFEGVLKVSSSDGTEVEIGGDHTTSSGLYHWADKDQDNRISDEEILTIYDLSNSNHHSEIEMDLLEEIWLGDGYVWLPNEQRFSILE